MSGAQSISTRRAYGVQRVCRVWHRARSSVYARRQATRSPAPCRRRGPIGAAPDDVLVAHLRRVLEASPFHGEGYRKAWAKLRVDGIRTSQERVRRLMRESGLQAPARAGHAHGPKAHDGTITTEAPDVMWGTDMTATVTVAEGAAFVFVAVDHCATECIGLHAAKRGNRFEALEPIRQGIRERFGGIGDGVARGLRLRHDHGSNYLADDFQQEVAFFGIESSPSFVREPEGNGVAERFIRTLKENVLWVRSFETIEELRLALLEFKRTYNEHWMLEKVRLPKPGPGATRPPWAGRGGVEANTVKPLSKNPEAVHLGTPFDESNVRKVFNRILDKAGLHRRGPHQMRHTFASLLLQAGAPITYVSNQLGHRDSSITLRVYVHWLPEGAAEKGVNRLDSEESVAKTLQRNQRQTMSTKAS